MKSFTTLILPCSCKHTTQDKMYGKGNRVHNMIMNPEKHGGATWRCTVCKREQ